jgi:hypothetical protein
MGWARSVGRWAKAPAPPRPLCRPPSRWVYWLNDAFGWLRAYAAPARDALPIVGVLALVVWTAVGVALVARLAGGAP